SNWRAQTRAQRTPLDVVHHHEALAVVQRDVEHARNVLMRYVGETPCLREEGGLRFRVVAKARYHALQSDVLLQPRIEAEIHLAHAARVEGTTHFVPIGEHDAGRPLVVCGTAHGSPEETRELYWADLDGGGKYIIRV